MPESLVSLPYLPTRPRQVAGPAGRVVRAAGFWLAILLPFVYVPVVVMGATLPVEPSLIVAAVVGNLLALLIGHGHEPKW